MNPPCARCYKSVYPVEKLNILDKFWHKTCFKCTSCGTSLNLKTFKGFNKQPYCTAHYPKPEHSTIADDPESVRLRQQQQNVSNIEYHKEFQEKIKGQYRPVTDDPETMRLKKNTENQSSVAYRTDPSTMNYTPVSGEDPEMQRLKKNSEIQSSVKYRGVGTSENPPYDERQIPSPFNSKHGKNNTSASSNSTNQHQFKPNPAGVSANERSSFVNALDSQQAMMKQQVLMQEQQRRMQIEQQQKQIEEQQRLQAESRRKDELELQKQQNFERQQAEIMEKQRVERLEQEKRRRAEEEERQRQYAEQERSRQLQQAENRRRKEEEERRLAAEREEQLRFETEQKLRLNDPHVPVNNLNSATQAVNGNNHQPQEPAYRAEYDYFPDASDPEAADELMFEEGDIIVGLVKIDDGWSTGTNQRTGQSGMLPSNYITQIQ